MLFTVRPQEPGGPPGDTFEIYPTETAEFSLAGTDYTPLNVWSYAFRDIDPDCGGDFDWTLERFSYFVVERSGAPTR